jgi:hypothetical protein
VTVIGVHQKSVNRNPCDREMQFTARWFIGINLQGPISGAVSAVTVIYFDIVPILTIRNPLTIVTKRVLCEKQLLAKKPPAFVRTQTFMIVSTWAPAGKLQSPETCSFFQTMKLHVNLCTHLFVREVPTYCQYCSTRTHWLTVSASIARTVEDGVADKW